MEPSHYRTCACGAIYGRTEHMAESREIASFECDVCDQTMETWNTAWVPIYRFIAGPVRLPTQE
jgi:hypothetical protein